MRTVISQENIPYKVIPSIVLYTTVLSYWNAPEWAWGVYGVLVAILFISMIKDYAEGVRTVEFSYEDKEEVKGEIKK